MAMSVPKTEHGGRGKLQRDVRQYAPLDVTDCDAI